MLLQPENVVLTATRLCHPLSLSNGRQRRAAGEVVDARSWRFSFLRRGEQLGSALGVFFQWRGSGEQENISAKDAQYAIELMGEFDRFSGVTTMAGQGWQRDRLRAQGNGVIGGHDALVVQAETADQIEAAGQAAEVAGGVGGETGEALIVVGAKAGEHNVGLFDSGGSSQTKFADQAVLASAPGALDAAFGLGRVGRDLLDTELLESPSELSGSLFSGEQGPVRIVALEDGVTVAVEAEGNAVGGDHGVQGAETAHGIFGFELEVRSEDLAGSVVLKADQGKNGAATFEPIMPAGIGERHNAETRAGAGVASGTGVAGASAERPVWRPARCGARFRD